MSFSSRKKRNTTEEFEEGKKARRVTIGTGGGGGGDGRAAAVTVRQESDDEGGSVPAVTAEAVIAGMLTDPDVPAEVTLELLLRMELGKEEHREIRERFQATNISKDLVNVMKEKADNPSVLSIIYWNLAQLTYEEKCCHFAGKFIAADAGKLILEAMTKFPRGNPKMFENGSAVLFNLASYRRGAGKALGAGATEIVIKTAMKHFPDDEEIQFNSCGFLSNVIKEVPTAMPVIIDAGGTKAVIGAMNKHPASSNAQIEACNVLKVLITESKEEIKEEFKKEKGIVALAKAENQFGNNELVKEPASAALIAWASPRLGESFMVHTFLSHISIYSTNPCLLSISLYLSRLLVSLYPFSNILQKL